MREHVDNEAISDSIAERVAVGWRELGPTRAAAIHAKKAQRSVRWRGGKGDVCHAVRLPGTAPKKLIDGEGGPASMGTMRLIGNQRNPAARAPLSQQLLER